MVNPESPLKSSPRRSTAFILVAHGGGFAKPRITVAIWSASLAFPPLGSGGFARPRFLGFLRAATVVEDADRSRGDFASRGT
jgi:hypothetical protein